MTLAQLPYFYLRVETIIERPVDGLLPLKAKTQVHSQQVPSPNGSGFHSMAGVQRIINDFGGQENGLQFMNDKWNDTILNGNDFTLKWNRTIDTKKAILGVFRVTYPSQGVVVYESLENITSKRSAPLTFFKRIPLLLYLSFHLSRCLPSHEIASWSPRCLVLWAHSPLKTGRLTRCRRLPSTDILQVESRGVRRRSVLILAIK